MYESFYGFREKPFNLTPDPKYLYLSLRHTEAFAHLEFGRRERGGFAVITGEVGTGKTTLARYFLGQLGEGTATAVVLYPALTAAELLRAILDDLHVQAAGASLKDLVDALHRFLLEARGRDREVVLLIDEAQDLSAEVLEQIRLLSNLETDTEKLIQIVLMGQPELHEMLDRRELRQLAQRVTARYHLSPLDRGETEDYVRHRLSVAGGARKVHFTSGALAAIHRFSGGVPRLVNLVCDRALLAGYVQGNHTVHAAMVQQAAAELRSGPRRRHGRSVLIGGGAGAAAALLLLAVGLTGDASLPSSSPLSAPPAQAETAPPMPPASGENRQLERTLLGLARDASFVEAAVEVRRLWGGAPLQRTAFRTHLDQLRRLDIPVVLEMFHPARRDTCFVALVGLQGGEAVIAAGGERLRIRTEALDRLWSRQAVFFWRDFDASAGGEDAGRAAEWARLALTQMGYDDAPVDLAAAVARFQQDSDLVADGLVGERTLLVLYSLGEHARPRLSGGVAAHGPAGVGGAS